MKKLLALVLALVMTLSLASVSTNAAYTDADKVSDTYAEAVDVLSGIGVFGGYPDGSFGPQNTITRAEVAAIVYRLYTGDVKDAQSSLYASYNKFVDMDGAAWAKGYIGYCANAGFILGYGDGKFGPSDKVTGYQALAMILRAVGYGQNNEFTGADWALHVAQYAQQLGVLDNVKGVDLGAAATRELVAELLFQVAAYVDQVTYTPALGYQSVTLGSGALNFVKTGTLGYKNFGLAEYEGYVVANVATGATYTEIASKRNVAATLFLDKETGLDMIGHAVSGWYCDTAKIDAYGVKHNPTTYTMNDDSVAETVLAASDLVGKRSSTTVYSKNYGTFDSNLDGSATKWIVIDKGEAIISVVQQVAQVYAINNYAVTPTMTLEYATSDTRIYKQSALTGAKDLAIKDYVVVTDIANAGKIYNLYKLEQTVTGVYSYKDSAANVYLTDGTKLAMSPLFALSGAAANPNNKLLLSDAANLSIANSLVFLLDEDGRYVAYYEVGSGYLYGTYAYYTVDDAATAQLSYYLTGVTIDGQVVTKQITAAQYNDSLVQGDLTATESPAVPGIPFLSTHGQSIVNADKAGKDFVVTETANTGIYRVGNWTNGTAGVSTVVGNVIAKNSAVLDGTTNYFVDENTVFYFVTGSAAAPEVQTITGKEALLAGGDTYVLPSNSVMSVSVLNYSVNTAANYHVDKVLVKDAYSANSAKNLYYVTDGDVSGVAGATSVYVVDEVYCNDRIVPVWTDSSTTLTNNRFYLHNTVANSYGHTVEKLTKIDTAQNGIYAYYDARTNYTGTYGLYLVDGSSNIRVSNDAIVVDLRTASYAGNTANVGTNDLAAITTYEQLVNASAEYEFKVDAAGTSNNVTIVYIKSANVRDNNARLTVSFVGTGTNGVSIKGGLNDTTVSQFAAYGEVVYFTVADGATVKVNGVAKSATGAWVNSVWYPSIYAVTVTADTTITVTAPAAAVSTATYALKVTDIYGVVQNIITLGSWKDKCAQSADSVAWATIYSCVAGTASPMPAQWNDAGALADLAAIGINGSESPTAVTGVSVALGASATYYFTIAVSYPSHPLTLC